MSAVANSDGAANAYPRTSQTGQYCSAEVPKGRMDFGVGQPGPTLLPNKVVQEATEHAFKKQASIPEEAFVLQYNKRPGHRAFRDSLAQFLTTGYGSQVHPDELMVTAGVSHGLDLACRAFTKPGDIVLVEENTYFLAFQILKDSHVTLHSVPADASGMSVDALREKVESLAKVPALVYLCPTHGNPTGVTMVPERRQQLVQYAKAHEMKVISDDVYQLLSFPGHRPPPPLRTFDEEGDTVVSISSFSKIMAPGLRCGWVEASKPLLDRILSNGVITSGGCICPFTASIIQAGLELGLVERHLQRVREELSRRCMALCSELCEQIPHIEFRQPNGGYFVWVRVPNGIVAHDLLGQAAERGVRFCPGFRCSIDQDGDSKNFMRLSFAFYEAHEMKLGVARLAEALCTYDPKALPKEVEDTAAGE